MENQLKQSESRTSYEQMGRAALLPGMTHMVELMQKHLDEFREQLADLQQNGDAKRGPGRPVGVPLGRPQLNRYWASMTPEERSAEMTRRRAVRNGEAAKSKTAKPASKLPPQINGQFTMVGAAKELGLTPGSFGQLRVTKPEYKKFGHVGDNGNKQIMLFTARDIERMKKLRNGESGRWATGTAAERSEWGRRMQQARAKKEATA